MKLLEILSSSLTPLGVSTTNEWKATEMKAAGVMRMKHQWSKGGQRSSCVWGLARISFRSCGSSPAHRLKRGCILARSQSLPRAYF